MRNHIAKFFLLAVFNSFGTGHYIPSPIKQSRNTLSFSLGHLKSHHEARDELRKRAECGQGIGSCAPGQCCSEAGWCGTGASYCGGPSCQIEYSDSCDTVQMPAGRSTEDVDRSKLGTIPYGKLDTLYYY